MDNRVWYLRARTTMLEAGHFAASGVVLYEGPSPFDGSIVRMVYHISRTRAEVHLLPYPPLEHIGDLAHQDPEVVSDVLRRRAGLALHVYVPIQDIPHSERLFRDAVVHVWVKPSHAPVSALEPLSNAREVLLRLDEQSKPSNCVKTT